MKTIRWRHGAISLAVCAALTACAVGPDYHRPEAAVPGRFAVADHPDQPVRDVDPALWWRALGDESLNALVERALRDNLDLQRALERVEQAQGVVQTAISAALPLVDLGSGGGHGTGTDMTRGRSPAGLHAADHSPGNGGRIEAVSGADASWSLDWVGGLRRQIEAAQGDVAAAQAARDAVQVMVIAELVRHYLQLRGLQTRHDLLVADASALRNTTDVIRARFEHGITNEFDLTLAERQLAAVEAQLPGVDSQIQARQGAIAVLLGRFDTDIPGELGQAHAMPVIPDRINLGLPLDLLRRRPDVREAEARLAAQTARVGVATAALFPQLLLTAGTGTQYAVGTGGGHQAVWSAGYAAYFPILDFGALDAQITVASSRQREAMLDYRMTVIRAVQEVDDAVRNLQAQSAQSRQLRLALDASQRAVVLSSERYERGLTDFLNVSDAQRRYLELREQVVSTEMGQADQFVAAYRALGGGWESFRGPPELASPMPAVLAMARRWFHWENGPSQAILTPDSH